MLNVQQANSVELPDATKVRPAVRPFVYSVEWTDPPSLLPRTRQGEEGVLQKFANGDVLLIGKELFRC